MNGALYSILAIQSIKEEAKSMVGFTNVFIIIIVITIIITVIMMIVRKLPYGKLPSQKQKYKDNTIHALQQQTQTQKVIRQTEI